MANLKPALTPEEVKKAGVATVREEYNKLATTYNKILDGKLYFCHNCNEFHSADAFYEDKRFGSGLYPECKRSLFEEATDYDKETKERKDNREKTINVFQKLNLPFFDDLYKDALDAVSKEGGEKTRSTAYQQLLVMVKTLKQYRGMTWDNSIFDEENNPTTESDVSENSRIVKSGKKRFGKNYSNDELYWLENEYQDWVARYTCESKAQENLFKILCQQELERETIRKNGGNTKDIDKSIQDTMNALGIKPSQSNAEALADQMSFGMLIDKWEQTKPIPMPEDEFEDPDRIGLLIDVFYKGHLSVMMGLKNAFSNLYHKYMKKYTVEKPELNEEEEEALFNQIFGEKAEGD